MSISTNKQVVMDAIKNLPGVAHVFELPGGSSCCHEESNSIAVVLRIIIDVDVPEKVVQNDLHSPPTLGINVEDKINLCDRPG
jgi:hypothetical protein